MTTEEPTLVKTLDFQLDIQSHNESLLKDATLEARWVYNETIRLAKQGVDWDDISPALKTKPTSSRTRRNVSSPRHSK